MKVNVEVGINDSDIEKAVRHMVNRKVKSIIKEEVNKVALESGYTFSEEKKEKIRRELWK